MDEWLGRQDRAELWSMNQDIKVLITSVQVDSPHIVTLVVLNGPKRGLVGN
jgi:hypothetical protein